MLTTSAWCAAQALQVLQRLCCCRMPTSVDCALTCVALMCAKVQALATTGADASALAYVRRMRRLNLTGRAAAAADGMGAVSTSNSSTLAGLAGQNHLLTWADKTFGQGLSSLTKGALYQDWCFVGRRQNTMCICSVVALSQRPSHSMVEPAGVKVLLAGEQQAAVTVAVEGLMDGKPLPDLESFLTFDPKVGKLADLAQHATCSAAGFPASWCASCCRHTLTPDPSRH